VTNVSAKYSDNYCTVSVLFIFTDPQSMGCGSAQHAGIRQMTLAARSADNGLTCSDGQMFVCVDVLSFCQCPCKPK